MAGIYDRDTLLRELRDFVIEVSFEKVNGQNRLMRCTLRPDMLPPSYINRDITEEKKFHKENVEVIAAWDVEKNAWRSFRVDGVKYVENVNEKY